MSQEQRHLRYWNLGDNATVVISVPNRPLTKTNMDRLRRYVDALEMEASISWEEFGNTLGNSSVSLTGGHIEGSENPE
jgi:hypothetical protein